MAVDPKDAAEIASIVKAAVDMLKGLGGVLKNYRVRKKQKEQIEKEAANVLRLATSEEIDELILKPRKKVIDDLTGVAGTTVRGRPLTHAVGKKAAPKMAARKAAYKKKAKKKKAKKKKAKKK